uniref:DUF6598 domain-containing protein n=1 Tax=Oryza nivara TaxID=4536 RepID=A0A0E0FVK5_ORYNI
MVDTDERWRAAVIGGGGDAATATEPSLPAAITRRLRELAWEDKDKEKARTVVDLVDSETPIECDHEEGHLCPSPCSDIPSTSGGGGGNEEMGKVNCNEKHTYGEEKEKEKEKEKVVETKSELKPKPRRKNWEEEELTWEEKVLKVLHMVRIWEVTEFDPKMEWFEPTRLCLFNTAFFDLDKESKAGLGPPIHSLTSSDYRHLETSMNIISIKVVESDVGYPISIFGTVLARDQYDYRCVYLFRRSRDNPQIITSPEDMLTLTGPKRGLGAKDYMFFEFNLKMKGDDGVDKDFSKGLLPYNVVCRTGRLETLHLRSWLSVVEFAFVTVQYAVEATLAVKMLGGASVFTGRVTAWTTGNDEDEIVLYDSEVADTRTEITADGSVQLNRGLVVVPLDKELVLNICVFEGEDEAQSFEFILGHYDEEFTCKQGCYEFQVNIIWTAVKTRRRPNMWKRIGCIVLLL